MIEATISFNVAFVEYTNDIINADNISILFLGLIAQPSVLNTFNFSLLNGTCNYECE